MSRDSPVDSRFFYPVLFLSKLSKTLAGFPPTRMTRTQGRNLKITLRNRTIVGKMRRDLWFVEQIPRTNCSILLAVVQFAWRNVDRNKREGAGLLSRISLYRESPRDIRAVRNGIGHFRKLDRSVSKSLSSR